MLVVRRPWNRNTHYHDLVLGAVPARCQCALDAGCGDGLLASELAERCGEVVGLDVHAPTLARARSAYVRPHLSFVEGGVMTHDVGDRGFDFVSAVAMLHHLPLEPALGRFRDSLRPDGVLAVVGLYRLRAPRDFAFGVIGKLARRD